MRSTAHSRTRKSWKSSRAAPERIRTPTRQFYSNRQGLLHCPLSRAMTPDGSMLKNAGMKLLSGALERKPMREDFAQDFSPDRLVGRRRTGPPPAVLAHRIRGGDKTVRDSRKISIGVVEAENQPAGADPAQRQAFGAQVIL